MSEVMSYLTQYGYLAMFGLLSLGFLGIPIPDETLVMMFGGLTTQGHFGFWITFLVSVLGSLSGMMLSYGLGRFVGKPIMYKYGKWIWITPKRLNKTEVWFERFGTWSILIGYFIPGIRQVTSYLSGVYRLKLRVYILYASIGSVVWCGTFMLIGRAIGHRWHRIMPYVHGHRRFLITLVFILVVLIISAVMLMISRKQRQRVAGEEPAS